MACFDKVVGLAVLVVVDPPNHGLLKEGFGIRSQPNLWLIKKGFGNMGQPVNTPGGKQLKTNLYSIALLCTDSIAPLLL